MVIHSLPPHRLEELVIDGTKITHEQVATLTRRLAQEVNESYEPDTELVLVTTLNGALNFAAHFSEELALIHNPDLILTDTVRVGSYEGTESTGDPVMTTALKEPIAVEGKHVLVVEDIADTLQTWQRILGYFSSLKPASVEMVTLLSKKSRHTPGIPLPRFVGMNIPDAFVVGEGLDWDGYYRLRSGIWQVVFE